jgi:hypothetical protein
MANQVYDALKEGLLTGDITLSADDIFALLVQETDATITISATEISGTLSFEYSGTSALELTETSGTNYTAYGYELSAKIVSASTSGTLYFDADDIVISASPTENTSITAGGILLYKKLTPIEASIPLIYFDYGVDHVTVNYPFTIQWHSTGILSLETKVV